MLKRGIVIPENVNEPGEEDFMQSEEDFMQILADHQNDLTYLELKDTIENLEPDQQMQLVALMYLGRSDFGEWKESCCAEIQSG